MSEKPSESKGPDLAAGIPVGSFQDGRPLLGHVEGEGVIAVRRGAEVFAIGASCSHYGGPLAEGLVVDDTVRCPWHHACFSLRTGEALKAPALNPVAAYEVSTREGSVVVTGKRAKPGTVRPRARAASTPQSVGIVGAGAAGNCVAEELRHLGFQGEITLFDGDRQAPYDRPNLSKDYLAGSAPEEWIPLHPRSYYEEHAIKLALGERVGGLDPGRRSLAFDDGSRREFGAIVLATGAEPVRLRLPGRGRPARLVPPHPRRQPSHHRGGQGRAAGGARRGLPPGPDREWIGGGPGRPFLGGAPGGGLHRGRSRGAAGGDAGGERGLARR